MYERTTQRAGRGPFDVLVDVLTAANRYDLALGAIPVAFVVALVAAHALGVPTSYALALAAVVGGGVVADACYLNPPVDRKSTNEH
jgi:uncharacterized membrane protein